MIFASLTRALLWGVLFFLTITPANAGCSNIEASVCLIVLDTASSPLSRSIKKELGQVEACHVRILIESNPAKAIDCAADDKIERIVLIAHAAQSAGMSNAGPMYLTWPRQLKGEEFARARASQVELIQRELSRIREYSSRGSNEGAFSVDFDEMRLQERLLDLKSASPAPIYVWGMIYDQLFTSLADKIRSRRRPLLSFSLAACEPNELRKRYPSLEKVAGAVSLEFAPVSSFASLLYGGEKVTIDSNWLRGALGM